VSNLFDLHYEQWVASDRRVRQPPNYGQYSGNTRHSQPGGTLPMGPLAPASGIIANDFWGGQVQWSSPHLGSNNLGFLDGHVESLDFSQTIERWPFARTGQQGPFNFNY